MTGPLPLTKQQGAALEVAGASVALSAGAGCGKTRVLTERFLQALESEKIPLRSIVALTFTEKAARELRGRVRRECRARLTEGKDAAAWLATLRGLEAAPITTFHGFCREVLARFPVEAGVEPGFRILEEEIAPTLRDEALAGSLRRWLAAHHPDFAALAVDLGIYATRQVLAELVADRARGDLSVWGNRSAEEIVHRWEEVWEAEGRSAILRNLADVARPCLELLSVHDCTHHVGRVRRALLLEHLPALESGEIPKEVLAAIVENARVQGGGAKTHWPSPEVFEAVKTQYETLRNAVKSASDRLDWDLAASLTAAEQGLRVARLAAEAIEDYDRGKRAEGFLDFDDLLLKTRDLLRDHGATVRRTLAESIRLILVDEFQDTDPVQAEILEQLAEPEALAGRLFLVGDRKQSIYRFRGAEPRIFQSYQERFPKPGQLNLTGNFRSTPEVLDFVNALFLDSLADESDALTPDPEVPRRDGPPSVDFVWAHEPTDDEEKAPAHLRRRVEARWLARLLARRLNEGWEIYERNGNQTRNARPGDVAFLFRSLNDAAPYEAALVAEGLDYYIVGGSAFFGQQEVIDLINLLSAIEDPLDAVALAGALRSPFFCVSDEGLFWLARSRAGDLPQGFAGWLQAAGHLSTADRPRVARASDLLTAWRTAKDRVPIADLVARTIEESGYEAALLGEPLGGRKRANVRKLVRLARRFDLQDRLTLADFVAQLRADLRKPPREEQAATTDERGDYVRLMTIHQAKGLEFPIVVLPDLDRKLMGERSSVSFDPRLGPLVRPSTDDDPGNEAEGPGSSLGWSTFRELEKHEESEEALRLFYVATTRAQSALILSAGSAADVNPSSPALKLLTRRFDRSTGACREPLPADWQLPRVRVIQEPPLPPTEGRKTPKRSRRAKLSTVAAAIERAASANSLTSTPAQVSRPRRVDLDPAATLGPEAARLDRLIRSILAHRDALDPRQLERVAVRAGRLQEPSAPPGLVARAIDLLAPWLSSPLARDLARAPEVVRAASWVLSWPPNSLDATAFLGRLDFAFRDHKGLWQLVVLSQSSASESRERLRLLLSARSAADLGLGTVVLAWRVRLGLGGELPAEVDFSDESLTQAIEPVLTV